MNVETMKRRILSKLDWSAPKDAWQWKIAAEILVDCGYSQSTFSSDRGYNYRDFQIALRELTEETVRIITAPSGYVSRLKEYYVPPKKRSK